MARVIRRLGATRAWGTDDVQAESSIHAPTRRAVHQARKGVDMQRGGGRGLSRNVCARKVQTKAPSEV